MDLTPLLALYPGIREFSDQDQNSIFHVFDNHPMRTAGMDLIYDRSPSFSSLLKHQSENFKSLVLDYDNDIASFCSISWGLRYINGEIANVAYIGDFRVKNHRAAAKIWRPFYRDLISFLKEQNQIEYFLTAVLSSNKEAIKNLVVHGPKNGFYYHSLKSQTMINLLWRKPFSLKKNPFSVCQAQPKDEPQIRRLLDQTHRTKHFGYVFSGENSEWQRRKKTWHNWKIEDFLLIRDGDQLIGCTLPWSPSHSKRMRVRNVNGSLRWALKLAPSFGLQLPDENENIKTLYLTHLALSPQLNDDQKYLAQKSFIDYIFRHRHQYDFHMLSMADETLSLSMKLKRNYILQTTEVNLYEVNNSEKSNFSSATPVGFEMSLV